MTDDDRKIRERLIAAYGSLSPFEQNILQLLSVVYEPANKTALPIFLRRAGIKGPKEHWLILPTIAPYLAKLQKLDLLDEEFRCHTAIVGMLSTEAVANGTFGQMAAAVQDELPLLHHHGRKPRRCMRLIRDLRIAIFSNDIEQIESITPLIPSHCDSEEDALFHIVHISTSPFHKVWFSSLPSSFQLYLLDHIINYSITHLEVFEEPLLYLEQEEEHRLIPEEERLPFHRLLARFYLWHGELDKLDNLLARHPQSFSASGFQACIQFIKGDNEQALDTFGKDLQLLRELTGKKTYFYNITGVFYILALLKANNHSQLDTILELIRIVRSQEIDAQLLMTYCSLEAVILAQDNKVVEAETLLQKMEHNENSIYLLFLALAHFWINGEVSNNMAEALRASLKKASDGGFTWLAFEYTELSCALELVDSCCEKVAQLRQETPFVSILNAVRMQESWKRKLEALIYVTSATNGNGADKAAQTRLIWLIGFDNSTITISPKEQRLTVSGEWSKGRPVALNRLYERHKLDYLTDQDRIVCNAIRREDTSLSTLYIFDPDMALPAMIGHPLLFLEEDPAVSVEFVKGEPELLVEETEEGIRLSFMQGITKSGVSVRRESRFRFKIVEMTEKYRRISKIISKEGLHAPKEAHEQVLKAIRNISSYMTVHSAIDSSSLDIAEVPASTNIVIQLLPLGSGFRLEMFVKPFNTGGPYLKPGLGVETIMAEVNGQRLQAKRNLQLEEAKAQEVERSCPTLVMHNNTTYIWYLYEIDDCLTALLELQEIKELVTLEWPEGEKLKVNHHASFDQVYLKIRKKRDWFEIDGHLQLDESQVLDMKKVLQLVKNSKQRFVPLGEGQFLALTQELYNRLIEFSLLTGDATDDFDNSTLRAHPLMTPALAYITQPMTNLDIDVSWSQQLQVIKEARDLKPSLPATLKAQLRDYQQAGYEWLCRLAHWGLGACLADDMGLGKTLQALAIILKRAPDGPTLIVAPTSVSINWMDETARFAPSLNIVVLGSKKRQTTVAELKENDVLITSYTLLQQEEKLLRQVEWQTIILDEAQAIKNTATKRSKAAMSLSGKFKLITTGTPIENHLGELWNLFRFITPGLLGSLNEFNNRFANPIERTQDPEARDKLKRLIKPFILRRTKGQVLSELPPRTDVLLQVEMSEDEKAFYEALRQQALQNINNHAINTDRNAKTANGNSMQILAEITKLRRACCNPQLVAPDISISSSKLKIFSRLVEDLRENNHKILVFSQFVGHLTLIRKFLDQKGFTYRYLDGNTPLKERKKEVDSFQAGRGDLFLISLKAGGLGLNLTAADYVIHMDPWWNPAVEDQASDRAHRIGQTLPVTIYRLVTKNTIEEKIVKLHREKRFLAKSLLDGSDMSARISSAELLNLIREQ